MPLETPEQNQEIIDLIKKNVPDLKDCEITIVAQPYLFADFSYEMTKDMKEMKILIYSIHYPAPFYWYEEQFYGKIKKQISNLKSKAAE